MRALAAEGVRRVEARSRWMVRRLTRRGPRPDRLLLSPPDIRPADPGFARDIYESRYRFAGQTVDTRGESPFLAAPPSAAWAAGLHGFRWLRHLDAAGSELAAANARALVADWIASMEQPDTDHAWSGDVPARRLIAWLQHSGLILTNADHVFYRRFLRAIVRHVRWLDLRSILMRGTEERLRARTALTLAALSLLPQGTAVSETSRALCRELDRQILPDGCHVSRNPAAIAHILADLLPVRACFADQGRPPPPELVSAIDRMIPALRFFVHRDGSLARFNGASGGQAALVARVLALDESGAKPLAALPHGGYTRLTAGGTTVLADTGNPPPPEYAGTAHAGALSVELSAGAARIVGNCGVDASSPQHVPLGRATAAHSTVVVADASSARFSLPDRLARLLGAPLMRSGEGVSVEQARDEASQRVVATHDGYASRFGIRHQRSLTLSADGAMLSGCDRLIPATSSALPPVTVALRFHLDASAAAAYGDSGDVIIEAADGGRWRFSAAPVRGVIEDSVAFATGSVVRARQIVIPFQADRNPTIDWRFERQNQVRT